MRLRFSIVITCYNQVNFISAATTSALQQTEQPKEIIVVDDASTDGSREVLAAYKDKIRLFTLTVNQGAIAARNYGAARAEGQYLVFLDGDDLLMPWALEVYEALVSHRQPAVILARNQFFSGDIPPLPPRPNDVEFVAYHALLKKDRAISLSASVYIVENQAFRDVGGWTSGIFHLDLQDLSAKLGLRSMILVLSPQTAFYRIHSSNSIHDVRPFVRNVLRLTAKEEAGKYPGGHKHQWDRRAWFGGLFIFWIRRSLRARLYKEAWALAMSGWAMILIAVLRRASVRLRGRRPVEKLTLGCADYKA